MLILYFRFWSRRIHRTTNIKSRSQYSVNNV